jgi:hypothetical protein
VPTPIVTTPASTYVVFGGHHEQTCARIEITDSVVGNSVVMGLHDLHEHRVRGIQARWVGEMGIYAKRFLRHNRNPRGKGSSGASMCCEVPVIHA